MDKLAVMATFMRVAERGTFSAAARELGLSQPAVSQQIAALERHLGARLFHRSTRRLTLSDSGAAYYRQAQQIVQALEEAEDAVRAQTSELHGVLRVSGPVGLGQTDLADALIAFRRDYPGLVVELLLDDRYSDLIAEGIDVAIRLGSMPSSGLVARKLGSFDRILVASAGYIAANGSPGTPAELDQHPHVGFIWSPRGDSIPLLGPEGPVDVPVRPVFLANNAFVLNKALLSGLGIGGAQLPLVQSDLDDGRLVRILPAYSYAPLEIHAVYPSGRFVPRKTRLFVEFLALALSRIPGIKAGRSA
ncbi:LysR family transcriptional regulator [Phyllobacterium sp. 0TCS1.6C]|uniref:LysR family transcriptional regulator n=1 Tax=unclassified Phyllobacterium TaxID=2638441 RepID=UPI00226428C5|nr:MULTISPECIES: LysR family transcriptional regulator [unclassified Phyllobacterium]MCX8281141.1 LysR family transcriptional regulator [Phyllobacterium sp. 0TCS1.6C]MCX8294572.1 LysR family transcriptional regulator [Phyllobacterium sp. 0TCS1.6A]